MKRIQKGIMTVAALLVLAAAGSFFGCGTGKISDAGSPGSGDLQPDIPLVRATKLDINPTVSTRNPYPAVMSCRGLGETEVMKGNFFWNSEGPYEYPVERVDVRNGKVYFRLHTGNPGTYVIRGFVTYRHKATGMIGNSDTVSAGAIRAH